MTFVYSISHWNDLFGVNKILIIGFCLNIVIPIIILLYYYSVYTFKSLLKWKN